MLVDPNQPVHLRKMTTDPKTGNIYIPLDRPYAPGELPLHLINDANCYQAGGVEIVHTPIEPTRTIQPSEEYLASQTPTKNLAPESTTRKRTTKSEDSLDPES